jgi:hypothetical protein
MKVEVARRCLAGRAEKSGGWTWWVKRWSNAGQTLVKHWSNVGQTLVKRWSNWSNSETARREVTECAMSAT